MDAEIEVEVACALPARQHLLRLRVPRGCTATQAIELSAIAAQLPEIDLAGATLGVWGVVLKNPHGHVLETGDRVEIYRPLASDPRTARRARAADSVRRGR